MKEKCVISFSVDACLYPSVLLSSVTTPHTVLLPATPPRSYKTLLVILLEAYNYTSLPSTHQHIMSSSAPAPITIPTAAVQALWAIINQDELVCINHSTISHTNRPLRPNPYSPGRNSHQRGRTFALAQTGGQDGREEGRV